MLRNSSRLPFAFAFAFSFACFCLSLPITCTGYDMLSRTHPTGMRRLTSLHSFVGRGGQGGWRSSDRCRYRSRFHVRDNNRNDRFGSRLGRFFSTAGNIQKDCSAVTPSASASVVPPLSTSPPPSAVFSSPASDGSAPAQPLGEVNEGDDPFSEFTSLNSIEKSRSLFAAEQDSLEWAVNFGSRNSSTVVTHLKKGHPDYVDVSDISMKGEWDRVARVIVLYQNLSVYIFSNIKLDTLRRPNGYYN